MILISVQEQGYDRDISYVFTWEDNDKQEQKKYQLSSSTPLKDGPSMIQTIISVYHHQIQCTCPNTIHKCPHLSKIKNLYQIDITSNEMTDAKWIQFHHTLQKLIHPASHADKDENWCMFYKDTCIYCNSRLEKHYIYEDLTSRYRKYRRNAEETLNKMSLVSCNHCILWAHESCLPTSAKCPYCTNQIERTSTSGESQTEQAKQYIMIPSTLVNDTQREFNQLEERMKTYIGNPWYDAVCTEDSPYTMFMKLWKQSPSIIDSLQPIQNDLFLWTALQSGSPNMLKIHRVLKKRLNLSLDMEREAYLRYGLVENRLYGAFVKERMDDWTEHRIRIDTNNYELLRIAFCISDNRMWTLLWEMVDNKDVTNLLNALKEMMDETAHLWGRQRRYIIPRIRYLIKQLGKERVRPLFQPPRWLKALFQERTPAAISFGVKFIDELQDYEVVTFNDVFEPLMMVQNVMMMRGTIQKASVPPYIIFQLLQKYHFPWLFFMYVTENKPSTSQRCNFIESVIQHKQYHLIPFMMKSMYFKESKYAQYDSYYYNVSDMHILERMFEERDADAVRLIIDVIQNYKQVPYYDILMPIIKNTFQKESMEWFTTFIQDNPSAISQFIKDINHYNLIIRDKLDVSLLQFITEFSKEHGKYSSYYVLNEWVSTISAITPDNISLVLRNLLDILDRVFPISDDVEVRKEETPAWNALIQRIESIMQRRTSSYDYLSDSTKTRVRKSILMKQPRFFLNYSMVTHFAKVLGKNLTLSEWETIFYQNFISNLTFPEDATATQRDIFFFYVHMSLWNIITEQYALERTSVAFAQMHFSEINALYQKYQGNMNPSSFEDIKHIMQTTNQYYLSIWSRFIYLLIAHKVDLDKTLQDFKLYTLDPMRYETNEAKEYRVTFQNPFETICKYNNFPVAEYLLKNHMNIITDRMMQDAWKICCQNDYIELAEVLYPYRKQSFTIHGKDEEYYIMSIQSGSICMVEWYLSLEGDERVDVYANNGCGFEYIANNINKQHLVRSEWCNLLEKLVLNPSEDRKIQIGNGGLNNVWYILCQILNYDVRDYQDVIDICRKLETFLQTIR